MKNIIFGLFVVTLFGCEKDISKINTKTTKISPAFIVGNYIGKTSYELRKTKTYLNIDSIQRTFGIQNKGYWDGKNNLGYAYVDINADGLDDIIYPMMSANTDIPMKPFVFLNVGNKYILDNTIIPENYIGATDTRKTLIADFNNDSLPDVFFNNTANEQSKNQNQIAYQAIMISVKGNKSVSYKMGNLPNEIINKGGYHGASAGDINNDGNADIIFVGQGVPKVLYGNGDGSFKYDIFNISSYKRGYITTEILDIDSDGKNDILFTGAENNDKSKIFWGSTNHNTFSIINDNIVNGLQLIVDNIAEDIDGDGTKEIILSRTYDGLDGTPFYRGYYITIYKSYDGYKTFKDVTKTFIYDEISKNNVTGGWITRINILKDNDGQSLLVADVNGCYQYNDYRNRPYLRIWKQDNTKTFKPIFN